MFEKTFLLKDCQKKNINVIETTSMFLFVNVLLFMFGIYENYKNQYTPEDLVGKILFYISSYWVVIFVVLNMLLIFWIFKKTFFSYEQGLITFKQLINKLMFVFMNNMGNGTKVKLNKKNNNSGFKLKQLS